MTIETAIRKLIETYIEAKDTEFIRDKVAWSLYQVWKEANDGRNK